MTDFTKEELEDIISWANVYTNFGLCFTYKLNKPLIDKIQSKINNYCDHIYDSELEVFTDVCKKCGALMLRNETLKECNE